MLRYFLPTLLIFAFDAIPSVSAQQSGCNVTCWCNDVMTSIYADPVDNTWLSDFVTGFCTFGGADIQGYCQAFFIYPYLAVFYAPYSYLQVNQEDLCSATCIYSNIVTTYIENIQSLLNFAG